MAYPSKSPCDDLPVAAMGERWRDAAIVVAMILLTLTLPVMIYGYLAWRQLDYFSLSYFVPYEAMKSELADATVSKVIALPLVEMNMTSGHILSSMYTLTLGQLVLSLALGFVMGLVLADRRRLHRICGVHSRQRIGAAAGAGTGLLATVGAASTGLLGCCGGSGLAGGVLALAGLSSTTAATLAQASPIIQLGLIAVFVAAHVRLRQRRAAAAGAR